MDNKIIRVVFNTDLRNSHDGLTIIAKELKVNTNDLKPGQFVVFVNTAKTAIKIYAAGNTVVHFRPPGGKKLNLKTIAMIPSYFNGGEFKYDKALKDVIEREIRP